MAEEPDILGEAEDIDIELTREQLRGLARVQIEALRHTAKELWKRYRIDCDIHVLGRLEFQLCGRSYGS